MYRIIDIFQHDKDEPDFDTPYENWEGNGKHYAPMPAGVGNTGLGLNDYNPSWDDIVKIEEEKND